MEIPPLTQHSYSYSLKLCTNLTFLSSSFLYSPALLPTWIPHAALCNMLFLLKSLVLFLSDEASQFYWFKIPHFPVCILCQYQQVFSLNTKNTKFRYASFSRWAQPHNSVTSFFFFIIIIISCLQAFISNSLTLEDSERLKKNLF